jgi:hypothetical protein
MAMRRGRPAAERIIVRPDTADPAQIAGLADQTLRRELVVDRCLGLNWGLDRRGLWNGANRAARSQREI